MPTGEAVSQSQQRMMAIAKHAPEKLYKKNRGALKMGKAKLHAFAATKRRGLPKKAGK